MLIYVIWYTQLTNNWLRNAEHVIKHRKPSRICYQHAALNVFSAYHYYGIDKAPELFIFYAQFSSRNKPDVVFLDH